MANLMDQLQEVLLFFFFLIFKYLTFNTQYNASHRLNRIHKKKCIIINSRMYVNKISKKKNRINFASHYEQNIYLQCI